MDEALCADCYTYDNSSIKYIKTQKGTCKVCEKNTSRVGTDGCSKCVAITGTAPAISDEIMCTECVNN